MPHTLPTSAQAPPEKLIQQVSISSAFSPTKSRFSRKLDRVESKRAGQKLLQASPRHFIPMPSGDTTAAIHVQHSRIDELVPDQREDSISEIISTLYPPARQPRPHLIEQAGTILLRQEAPGRGINNAWGDHRRSEHAVSGSRRTGLGRALRRHGCHRAVGRPTPGLCRRHGEAIARLWSALLCAGELRCAPVGDSRFVQDVADKPGTLARLPAESVAVI